MLTVLHAACPTKCPQTACGPEGGSTSSVAGTSGKFPLAACTRSLCKTGEGTSVRGGSIHASGTTDHWASPSVHDADFLPPPEKNKTKVAEGRGRGGGGSSTYHRSPYTTTSPCLHVPPLLLRTTVPSSTRGWTPSMPRAASPHKWRSHPEGHPIYPPKPARTGGAVPDPAHPRRHVHFGGGAPLPSRYPPAFLPRHAPHGSPQQQSGLGLA